MHDTQPKGAGLGSDPPLLELAGVLPFTSVADEPSVPLQKSDFEAFFSVLRSN